MRLLGRYETAFVTAVLAGCAGGTPAPAPSPSPSVATRPGVVRVPEPVVEEVPAPPPPLPAIPRVTGPLALRITYPSANQQLTARDSNFIFGSLGSGDAQLSINDQPVRVEPNGAFLAWLPIPAATGAIARGGTPTSAYRIVATLGTDTARLVHPVRLVAPRVELSNTGTLEIDAGSVAPRGSFQLSARELMTVRVRAPANATVLVRDSAGTAWPLRNGAQLGLLRGIAGLDSAAWSGDVPARVLASAKARLVVSRGGDSVSSALATVRLLTEEEPQLGALKAAPGVGGDTDAVVVARPTPGGTYRWMLFPGTVVPITGRNGNAVRIRLDRQLEVWVEDGDITPLPSGTAMPRRTTGAIRAVARDEWVDVIVPAGDRPPYQVTEDGRQLVLTLYATTPASENVVVPANDPLLKAVRYEQPSSDRARIVVDLNDDPFGYLVLWSGTSVVLRIRRWPAVDAARPLAGLVIAVDPGHPPIGSTGPTGLTEAVATLAVGERLRAQLEARGARVFMTRTTDGAVPLNDRAPLARQQNVHAFVSIHLNALPDGVNPFVNRGTGTYYYFPHSVPLAKRIQPALLRTLGLHDEGVLYQNLAVARNPWFPAVLCEGAYIMRPDHEAALRQPEFQEGYARAIADGLEAFFRSRVHR